MPHKHNVSRRHHIGKMKFKVTNWQEYEACLRRRGSMTRWITPDALAGWAAPPRKTRGGQPLYSDLAIETALMLGMVFGLRLRQSEGLLGSVLDMMGLDLPVPDHTTLSRRARTWKPSARSNDRQHLADGPIHVLVDSTGLTIYGAGQWLEEKHGAKSRRGWRKLHLVVDADIGEIIAHSLTDQETGDAPQLEPLLDQTTMGSTSSLPMELMMAIHPTTLFCVTVQARGSSFHRARTQLTDPTSKHAARETIT
jgi:hypothetical protein